MSQVMGHGDPIQVVRDLSANPPLNLRLLDFKILLLEDRESRSGPDEVNSKTLTYYRKLREFNGSDQYVAVPLGDGRVRISCAHAELAAHLIAFGADGADARLANEAEVAACIRDARA